MYDNGYIVKCRSILTNDICLSEASHKADVFLYCTPKVGHFWGVFYEI